MPRPHVTLLFIIGLAAGALGASGWFLLRPERPLHVVEECWRGYRDARSAADTAAVDRHRVTVTPTRPDRAPARHEPFTCGSWREFRSAGAVSPLAQ